MRATPCCEDKMAEDGKYVPNPRVAYCMVQMLSMQTVCCMLHDSMLGHEQLRMWHGKG